MQHNVLSQTVGAVQTGSQYMSHNLSGINNFMRSHSAAVNHFELPSYHLDLYCRVSQVLTRNLFNYCGYYVFSQEIDKGYRIDSAHLSQTPSPQIDVAKEWEALLGFVVDKEQSQKRIALNQLYLAEKDRYYEYLAGLSGERVDELFKTVTDKILEINFKSIGLEITPYGSLFFEVQLSDAKMLHLKLILSDLDRVRGFFALYENDDCIDNGIGPINEIVSTITETFARPHDSALSRNTSATR